MEVLLYSKAATSRVGSPSLCSCWSLAAVETSQMCVWRVREGGRRNRGREEGRRNRGREGGRARYDRRVT